MGMFSWCCKGCGHEIKTDEFVRMNGCVGFYDGYGRVPGSGFDGSLCSKDPSCWHEVCYQKATVEQKLDETPSDHAANQGFGYSALEFMQGYDPRVETTFEAVIFVDHYDQETKNISKWEYYINKIDDNFVLRDVCDYRNKRDEFDSDVLDAIPEFCLHNKTGEEMYLISQQRIDFIEKSVGPNPKKLSVAFDGLEKAKLIVGNCLEQLPHPEYGFHLIILGKQGKICGQCYERNRTPEFKKVFHQDGDDFDFVNTGKFTDDIVYAQGIKLARH